VKTHDINFKYYSSALSTSVQVAA